MDFWVKFDDWYKTDHGKFDQILAVICTPAKTLCQQCEMIRNYKNAKLFVSLTGHRRV